MKNHLVALDSIITLCGKQYGKGAPWGPLTHTRNVEEATCRSCLNSKAIEPNVMVGRLIDNRRDVKHELMYIQISSPHQGSYRCSCGLVGEIDSQLVDTRALVLERLEVMHKNHAEIVAIRKQI